MGKQLHWDKKKPSILVIATHERACWIGSGGTRTPPAHQFSLTGLLLHLSGQGTGNQAYRLSAQRERSDPTLKTCETRRELK